ncbi:MAG: RluA family pseudouridine synthase [Planctomycetota bacterium]
MAREPALAPGRYTVTARLAGERLDRALQILRPGVSRTRLQEWVRDGGIRVDGVVVDRPAFRLEAGTTLELVVVPRSRLRPGGPSGAVLAVIYEDEHLAVIDKPPGMVTHPSALVGGATVSELAEARWGSLPVAQGEDRPGIVHRLDAGTSGLLVLARRAGPAEELVRQFRSREVEKTYLAIVFGEPRFDSDWIDAPIGRAGGAGDRLAVVPAGEGLPAETFYRTLHRARGFGVLACQPRTGRTHQIRVHLASIDHPLVGDPLYRGRRGLSRALPAGAPPLERQALHAAELRFRHPATGESLAFRSPVPADLAAWLRWLGASPLLLASSTAE